MMRHLLPYLALGLLAMAAETAVLAQSQYYSAPPAHAAQGIQQAAWLTGDVIDLESWVTQTRRPLFDNFWTPNQNQTYYNDPGGQLNFAPGYCEAPCGPTCAPAPVTARWKIFADALYLHPTDVDMAHAQQQDGIGGAGTVPFGVIGTVDPGYDLGFRVGGEYYLEPTASILVSYLNYESNASQTVNPPDIPGGGGAVGSLVHHPNVVLTASPGPLTANYGVDWRQGEIAYSQALDANESCYLSYFVGGRFSNLSQGFVQRGVFGGGAGGTIDTATNIEFDGGGPVAGLNAEQHFGCRGFSIYGHSALAALAGEFRSQYVMRNTTTDVLLANAIWKDDRIVPMLDYEFGVAWTGPSGHFRIAAGYMATYWFNAVTTPEFINAVQADNYVSVTDVLSFDGLVGRVETRW